MGHAPTHASTTLHTSPQAPSSAKPSTASHAHASAQLPAFSSSYTRERAAQRSLTTSSTSSPDPTASAISILRHFPYFLNLVDCVLATVCAGMDSTHPCPHLQPQQKKSREPMSTKPAKEPAPKDGKKPKFACSKIGQGRIGRDNIPDLPLPLLLLPKRKIRYDITKRHTYVVEVRRLCGVEPLDHKISC